MHLEMKRKHDDLTFREGQVSDEKFHIPTQAKCFALCTNQERQSQKTNVKLWSFRFK